MKMRTMYMIIVLLFIALCIVLSSKKEKPITYYAVFADGRTKKTGDEYGVYPISEPNDVAGFYPYFIAEIDIDFRGDKLHFRSGPLIFSENPEIQGRYGKRMVYYVKRTEK